MPLTAPATTGFSLTSTALRFQTTGSSAGVATVSGTCIPLTAEAGIGTPMVSTSGMLTTHRLIHPSHAEYLLNSAYAAYIAGILINVVGFAGAST